MSRLLLLSWLTVAGCVRDPAHDRPIEPWASPDIPPTSQAGDVDEARDAAVDAGSTK